MKTNKLQEIDHCIFINKEKAIIDRLIAHLFATPTKQINRDA